MTAQAEATVPGIVFKSGERVTKALLAEGREVCRTPLEVLTMPIPSVVPPEPVALELSLRRAP